MKKSNTVAAIAVVASITLSFTIGSCDTSSNRPRKEYQGREDNPGLTEDRGDNMAALDFNLNDIDGNNVNFMSEVSKNKLTILDFWASWCRPCMDEMPNMINIYNKYSDKGLGIVGVSLDEREQDWKGTIKSKGLKWLQLSDLQGWESPVAKKYGVQSIPHIIVIDQKGNIIADNLRGASLEEFISRKIE